MNQRVSGHNWERECVKILSSLFNLTKGQIGTTRENSRAMDNAGIDIWFENPVGIDFQCKEKTTNSETLIPLEASYIDYMNSKNEKAILFKTYGKKQKKECIRRFC